MNIDNAPIYNPITSESLSPVWEDFITSVADVLTGTWDYTNRKFVYSAITTVPSRQTLLRQNNSLTFLIQFDVNVNLSGTIKFGSIAVTSKQEVGMLGGFLSIYDGNSLVPLGASCLNDTITLPTYSSTNGSVTIQGTILAKNENLNKELI